MKKKIAIAVGSMVGALLLYVAALPSKMHLSRELVINAPASAIFPHINHSKKADAWMPWSESDPDMKMTYSGPNEGVGSTSNWSSTGDMGVGQAVVVESVLNSSVKTQLTYTKPSEMSQVAEISLTPTSAGTIVRWEVTGENPFMGRLFFFLTRMEGKLNGEFDKGLLKLKSIVEPH